LPYVILYKKGGFLIDQECKEKEKEGIVWERRRETNPVAGRRWSLHLFKLGEKRKGHRKFGKKSAEKGGEK